MPYNPYTRPNQQILDAAIVGISFYLAFLIRFEGGIPPYHEYQFWAFVLPVIVGRLLTNWLFGLHRVQWRYIGFRDTFRLGQSYLAFSGSLLLIRLGFPTHVGIVRIPASVITIELLLSLFGAMGIRLVRRHMYEIQSKQSHQRNAEGLRRLLLIGAGRMGANVAKEMTSHSSIQIVGFLDDDPGKF